MLVSIGWRKKMKTRKILWIATLIAILSTLPGVARAGSVGSDILTMFPKESGELAYANLKEARAFPWFNQLKEQMLPAKFREFETFLSSAGIDPNTQVTELAWALVPSKSSTDNAAGAVPTMDQIVGVALGQFNPASAGAYFTSKKPPIAKARRGSLFAFGGGSGPN